jgi:SWI/SNF-related matrix-associated actin-dependent regulator of chromatin subfamily D
LEFDGFEVKRQGAEDTFVRIQLFLEQKPPHLKVSKPLSQLIKVSLDTKPRILVALWNYIKSQRLQDAEDRKLIVNNQPLKEVQLETNNFCKIFGCEKMTFAQIPELLAQQLTPPDPIEFEYQIKNVESPAKFFDVPLQLEEPVSFDQPQKQIEAIDADVRFRCYWSNIDRLSES